MELRVLTYFLTVAREENITKAAQLLHVTQPTLSRQLMQLEEELGVKLFRRSNHSIVLTEEGLLLKRRAEELVALAEKTKNELSRSEETLGGLISIGSGEYRCSDVLADLFAEFHAQNPLVRFEIFSGNSDSIKEKIEQGSLELGLLLEPVDISRYDFLRVPAQEEWGAFVPESSELACRASVTAQELAVLPLLFSQRELVQNELKNWFGESSEHLNIVGTGNLTYNMASLVKSGLGVFLGLNLNCSYDGVRFVPLSPPLRSGIVLVWKKAQPHSATVQAFLEYAEQYVRDAGAKRNGVGVSEI